MKAQLIYKDGYKIIISKDNNSSLLFIEWVSQFRAAKSPIHKIVNSEEYLEIRLNGTIDIYESCITYINQNL